MVTFNEQKGQGTFQPVLSEPGGSAGGSGRTVPGPALGAAATAVEGAADIFKALIGPLDPEHDSENLAANKADLEALLAGEASLIAGQPITGGVIPGAKEEISQVAAAYDQNRISRNEMNVRLASIVQRFVSQDPRNAEAYRDIARVSIGYQPSAQIIADRLADEQFRTDQQREIARDEADYAIQEYGVVVMDEAGGVDVEATSIRGRQFRQQDAEMRRLKQKYELLKLQAESRNARKLTDAEINRLEYKSLIDGTQHVLDGHLEGLNIAMSQLSGLGTSAEDNAKRGALESEIQQRRSAIQRTLSQVGIQNGLGRKAIDDATSVYLSQFDDGASLATGDLSDIAVNKRLLDSMEVNAGLEVAAAAPNLLRLKTGVGEQALAGVINVTVAQSPELKTATALEVNKILGNVAGITGGVDTPGPSRLSDVGIEDRKATAEGLFTVIGELNKRPQRMTEQQQQSYIVSNAEIIDAALNDQNVNSRANAAARLSSNANLSALEALRANDSNAEQVGEQLRNLNAQAFVDSARRVPSDTTASQLAQGVGNFVRGRGFSPTTFTPVYNAETGRVEIEASGSGNPPAFMSRQVERMNNNLDTIVRLKTFGNSEMAGADDMDIKLFIASSAGNLEIKNAPQMEQEQ